MLRVGVGCEGSRFPFTWCLAGAVSWRGSEVALKLRTPKFMLVKFHTYQVFQRLEDIPACTGSGNLKKRAQLQCLF